MKRILTSVILAFTMLTASADEWINATSAYLINPSFNGNVNGWSNTVSYFQNSGYQGAYYSNGSVWITGFYEVWTPSPNTLGAGNIYQTVYLPEGKYKFETDAIATKQDGGWQAAASSNVTGVNLFAQAEGATATTTKITTGDGAPQHFSHEFTLSKDSKVSLGAMIMSGTTANWVAIDNCKLSVYGTMKPVIGISISEENVTMEIGATHQLTASYIPEDATLRNCSWKSSNTTVATVDAMGVVTATGLGTCTITATAKDGTASAKTTVNVVFTPPTASQLTINEIQVSNYDMFLDPSFNYGSWVELYNATDKDANLGYLYVTDDASNLKKHHLRKDFGNVPAHGFKNLWFDHQGIWNQGELRQIGFKLNIDGGIIIISDGENIIAQQTYPAAKPRISYARKTDGGEEWGLSGDPTPEKTNTGMPFATTMLPAPQVNVESQVFTGGSISINITNMNGATLRYTTDGSVPTLNNGYTSTTGNFAVTNTSKVYRYRLFKDGYLPSDVTSRTFIYNSSSRYKLPIVSVQTANANLNGTNYGVFQKGPNGRAGNGQDDKCNWNMDWERPVNFEYFDVNDEGKYEVKLNQMVDLTTCGGWSRAWTPHSFKLKASKLYGGLNSIDYQFFKNKPHLKHKTLQLRNGGNDTGNRIKDAALQQIVQTSGLYVDGQSWQPAHVFINGNYYAVLNIREPNNKHYAVANYGIDDDAMDQFEINPDSAYVQMEGTKDAFNRIYQLSKTASNADSYEQLCKLIDMDEYINYMAIELYLGNWDWPQNNVKGFRDQADGKFHFVIFDLDGAFSTSTPFNTFTSKQNYTFDNLRGTDAYGNSLSGQRKQGEIEFVSLFMNLAKNTTFRKKFVDAYCVIGGSVFKGERVKSIVNEMVSIMSKGGVNSASTGNEITNNLNDSYNARLVGQLKSGSIDFGVKGVSEQDVTLSSNVENAHILVNDMQVPTDKFSGKLFSPVTLTAVAPAGYRFLGWQGTAKTTSNTKEIFPKGSTWLYYDKGSLDGYNWKSATYNTTSWKSGATPAGYSNGGVIGEVTKTAQSLLTYYFRKNVTLDEAPSNNDEFTLSYVIDDGFVVYVNGTEAGRYNMPSGQQGYSVAASTYAPGNPDSGTMTLPANLFKKGDNTIAVEVHNNSTTSSDIVWNASLSHTVTKTIEGEYISTDSAFTMSSSGSVELVACYEKIDEKELARYGTTPVKINEVSAGNDMYVNDYFKKDDWIELYNTTDKDIDVAGMYLSDDAAKPQKFQIPDNDVQNTVIPAHGTLVIWASKRNNIGTDIHATFKLGNNDGEKVILTAADGSWSDVLTYNAHGAKESVGLYPDGGAATYLMSIPTIDKPNQLTSDATYLWKFEPKSDDNDGIEDIADSATVRSVSYYTIDGQHILTTSGKDTNTLPSASNSAIIIAKYRLSDGSVRTKKIRR